MSSGPLAISAAEMQEMVRKRDAFVTSMAMLRNAADEASRASMAYFDIVTLGATHGIDIAALRAFSVAPHHEETDGRKRRKKREVKLKDPNAPKKPSTPYFLFCSAGRETVKNDLGPNATFKEVQDELKNRWEVLDDKQKWSDLYQELLSQWKVQKHEYDETKAIADGAAMPPPATTPTTAGAAAGGFTAVNHARAEKSTPQVTESDDDSADETADEPVAEDEEEEEEEEVAPEPVKSAAKKQDAADDASSDSSDLTPPPKEKPKATPRASRKAATKVAATPAKPTPSKPVEPVVSATKKRKARGAAKKPEEDKPEPIAELVEETPKRKARKRRKSAAAE